MNDHLHPLFSDILNTHARIAVQFAAPSVQAEMQAIADRIKARNRRPMPPVPPVVVPKSPEELRAELAQLEAEFDPAFQWADDYTVWTANSRMAVRIAEIKREIKA